MSDVKILEKIFSEQEEAIAFVKSFSKKFDFDYLSNVLDSFKNLKVLLIGEAIVDEYWYGKAIGKSSKDPILALKHMWVEKYAGGILTVANHLASFCNQLDLVTLLGREDSQEEFIRNSLAANIKPLFFYKDNAATIVKRRFIEMMPLTKLLELYVMNDERLNDRKSAEIENYLEKKLPEYDLVICMDYGHGFINEKISEILSDKSKFYAVNTQANAGNIGYHTISKYKRADFICINEPEARLEVRDRDSNVSDITKIVAKRLSCEMICVTRGKNGCLIYVNGNASNVPAFTDKTVDRVGSGDAFLAITAPLMKNNILPEVIGFIGNAVGALAVNTVGNKKSINKDKLLSFMKIIMDKSRV